MSIGLRADTSTHLRVNVPSDKAVLRNTRSKIEKGNPMSYRIVISTLAAAILGIACISTDADARRGGGVRAGGVHAGGARVAGVRAGGARVGYRGGAYRGAYVRRGVGAAAVGAAAVGATRYYNNGACGYYPNPPCY
jgi:hypothetical protein